MNCECKCNDNTIKCVFSKTKTLTFNFDSDLDEYSAQFVVRKDLNTPAVLSKTINDLEGKSFDVTLTPQDNSVYTFANNEDMNEYIWGLDLFKQGERIQVFPKTGANAPHFLVFKNVVVNQ